MKKRTENKKGNAATKKRPHRKTAATIPPPPRKTPHVPGKILRHASDRNGTFVVCYDGRSRVLVGRMTYGEGTVGQWTLPGGGIHPGEEAPLAALRELHEEAGIFAGGTSIALVGLIMQRIPSAPGETGMVALYEMPLSKKTSFTGDGELGELRMMSVDEALRRRAEFSAPQLRMIWLAHIRRHGKNAPKVFSATMTSPVQISWKGQMFWV